MGFDCGFDVYPRLEATAANKQTYKRFLEEIIHTYDEVYDKEGRRADGKFLDMPTNSDQSDKVNGRRVSAHAQQYRPVRLFPPL